MRVNVEDLLLIKLGIERVQACVNIFNLVPPSENSLNEAMSRFDTIPACDRQTDKQTDRIAVASTALAMRALRRAVKLVKQQYVFRLSS